MIDPQTKSEFKQSIYVARCTGVDEFGQPTYGTPALTLARLEYKRSYVETAPGVFQQSAHQLATDYEIRINDKIWLPGADKDKLAEGREPMSVDIAIEIDGSVSHYEVKI